MKFFVDPRPPISRARFFRGIVVGALAFFLFGILGRILFARLPDWAWFAPPCTFLLLVAAWYAFILVTRRKMKAGVRGEVV